MQVEELSIHDPESNTSATIAPSRGALVTSLSVAGRELLYLDRSTLLDPTKNVRGGIPVLFPSPGKLTADRWEFEGRTGELKQHGFARNHPWRVMERRPHALTLELEANATSLRSFPWRYRLQCRFAVGSASLRVDAKIQNEDSSVMPFALGFHPYFAVVDKSIVTIPTAATRAFNNVTKRIEAFGAWRLDAGEVDQHLLDHGAESAHLQFATGCRVTVRASPEFKTWVVWTLPEKDFVCLEPWTAPGDALNTHEHLLKLGPGESAHLWMEIVSSSAETPA